MNSFDDTAREVHKIDPVLASLYQEVLARRRAANATEVDSAAPAAGEPRVTEAPPKHIFVGPKYDGKQCAICQRHFKSSSEYVTCKLCGAVVCRRKGTCKSLHRGQHRVAYLKRWQADGSDYQPNASSTHKGTQR